MKLSKNMLFWGILGFLFCLTGCARFVPRPAFELPPSGEKWVQKTIASMTLEEKVGQMICCRYSGRFAPHESDFRNELFSLVREQKIGGLILFGGNVYETAYLTNDIQKAAKVPLLISSDLERGLGNQIEGATLFPPLMSIGATGSEELAYLMGKITALEARALGIHVTYAPVVDVNINPENPIINTRSFGQDPESVSRMAIAFIKGCQENGLIATAKHFPGHGDTNLDSHSVLPTVSGDRERLENVELYPFRQVIDAGVQAIMSAHLRIPALDPTPDVPATLSQSVMTGLLRETLGFRGIVVTDAMDMGGVTTLYEPELAALMAVKAGVDMILLPPKPKEVIEALVAAVKREEILETRIDASVRRILEAKARLGLHKRKLVDLEILDRSIAPKAHGEVAKRAFEQAITLVKNEKGIVPFSGENKKIFVFSLSSDPGDFYAGQPFIEELKARYSVAGEFYADAFTGEEFIKEAVSKAKESDILVVALFSRLGARKGSVDLNLRHIQIVMDLSEGSLPIVAVSFGSPYFLKHFPKVDAYMCAYRHAPEAQKAAVKALLGLIPIKGKLPVSIPGLYEPGHGYEVPVKIQE